MTTPADQEPTQQEEAAEIASVESALEVETPPEEPVRHQSFHNMAMDVDASRWPTIRLKAIRIRQFGPHDDLEIDFGDQVMHCLVGPNGIGKTTTLMAVQMLFANFAGYDHQRRYMPNMLRHVRSWMYMTPSEQDAADFAIDGVFTVKEVGGTEKEYRVGLRRQVKGGFTGGHPGVVRMNLPHYCFTARFDQELHNFQVRRDRWTLFTELFEAVTGFHVEEDVPMLDGRPLSQSADRKTQKIMAQYVLGCRIRKPRETITQKQCSAGERKIAKSLSTILNKPVQPNIILIDNVTDHVELGRHLPVMAALERCFSASQIVTTCHSQPVQRNLPDRDRLIDLRFLHANDLLRSQPWRYRLYDDVVESMDRIASLPPSDVRERAMANAKTLARLLVEDPKDVPSEKFAGWMRRHLEDVGGLWVDDSIGNTPPPRIKLAE